MVTLSSSSALRVLFVALLITGLSACCYPDIPIEKNLLGFRVGETVDLDDLIERQSDRSPLRKSRYTKNEPPENYIYQAEGMLYSNYIVHFNSNNVPLYIELEADEGDVATDTIVRLIPYTNIVYSIEGEISVSGDRFDGFREALFSRYEEKYGRGSSLAFEFLGGTNWDTNMAKIRPVWWNLYWERDGLSLGINEGSINDEDVRLLLVNEALTKRFESAFEKSISEAKQAKEEQRKNSIRSTIDSIELASDDSANQ